MCFNSIVYVLARNSSYRLIKDFCKECKYATTEDILGLL